MKSSYGACMHGHESQCIYKEDEARHLSSSISREVFSQKGPRVIPAAWVSTKAWLFRLFSQEKLNDSSAESQGK